MKAYSDAALAAIADGSVIVSGALAIYCDPPVFLWGGQGSCTIDGDVYLGVDDRSVGQVSSGAIGGAEQNVEITLSGVDPEALVLLDAAELNSASAKVYRLLFDSSGTVPLDCRIYKRGRVDSVKTQEVIGGRATVTLSIESAARGLGRQGGRMRSDADQRLIDPLDGFFKHVSYAATKVIYFGGKPSSAAATASG